jgi:glutathione S-transferase
MLTVHHLGHSQSERIVWLCEELAVPYELRRYTRDPATRLSPPELKALHPLGAAPVIEEGDLMLAESAAIVEYIIARHGAGRLKPGPEHPDYAAFLYWFHFANGTLQPACLRMLTVGRAQPSAQHPAVAATRARLERLFALVEERLSAARYFAGNEFTAADVMSVFSLTTMRLFQPFDLAPHPHIRAYLRRIGERPAYRRAMQRSDPDLVPLLD